MMCVLKQAPCRQTSRLIYYASPYSISLSCFPGDRMERPEVGVKRKYQEADLCHINQRQSILNISMTKLRISPMRRVEPSLRRKVLIFNTLRHIEGELRDEGAGWSPPHSCPSLMLPSLQSSEDLTLDPPPPSGSEGTSSSMDVGGSCSSVPPMSGPYHVPSFQSELHQSSLAAKSPCMSPNAESIANPVLSQSLPVACPVSACREQSTTSPGSTLPHISLPCTQPVPVNSLQSDEHASPHSGPSLHPLQPMSPVSVTAPCNNNSSSSFIGAQTPAQPFTDYFSDNKCMLDSFSSLLEPEPTNGVVSCTPFTTNSSSVSNTSLSSPVAVPVTGQQQAPHPKPSSNSYTQPQTHLTVLSTASHCQSSSSSNHHSYTTCSWSSSSSPSSTIEDFFTDFETATSMDFDLMMPLSPPTVISSSSTTCSPMFTNSYSSLSHSSCGTFCSASSISQQSSTGTLKLTPLSSEDILQTLPCSDSFPSLTSSMSSCNPKTDLPWDDLENVMQLLVGMI